MTTPVPATLDELIAHLVSHKTNHPEQGGWPVEVRDRLVVIVPQVLTHDSIDQVVILFGIPAR